MPWRVVNRKIKPSPIPKQCSYWTASLRMVLLSLLLNPHQVFNNICYYSKSIQWFHDWWRKLACILCARRNSGRANPKDSADPMEILGGSAVQMWNSHKQHFPRLLPLAAYVLSIPPGSSEAERSVSKSKSRCAYLETQLDPANFQRRLLIALNYMNFKENFLACATNTRKSNTE